MDKRSRFKKKSKEGVRADEADKTVHLDLCLVPASYSNTDSNTDKSDDSEEKSSEKKGKGEEYPGEVFHDKEKSYDEKMQTYVEQREEKEQERKEEEKTKEDKEDKKREIKEKEEKLRIERREERRRRQAEDEEWKRYHEEWKEFKLSYQNSNGSERAELREEKKKREEEWKTSKQERKEKKEKRQEEDQRWREEREKIRASKLEMEKVIKAFFAILVVIDSCTRCCLALPMFKTGRNVTAEEIVEALKGVLPSTLRYIISDNGTQFVAELFQKMCTDSKFIHVRITPHRPKTNGIAERFIRTLKGMLFNYEWDNAEELERILTQIHNYYNDRPHQGKELKGLSPNEYERRLKCSRLKCAT